MTWRPMKSAPLNWTHVLVVDRQTREVCEAYWNTNELCWLRANTDEYSEDNRLRPYRWMPLPEPPARPARAAR